MSVVKADRRSLKSEPSHAKHDVLAALEAPQNSTMTPGLSTKAIPRSWPETGHDRFRSLRVALARIQGKVIENPGMKMSRSQSSSALTAHQRSFASSCSQVQRCPLVTVHPAASQHLSVNDNLTSYG